MSDRLIRQVKANIQNLFSLGEFKRRRDDGSISVKTASGRTLEKKEAFPYGFCAKAETGKVFVLCQGGNFNGSEIMPLIAVDDSILSKLNENDAAIYTLNNGCIKIAPSGNGKVFLGNDQKNICGLICGLIDEIKNLITTGTAASQTILPATQIKLEGYKQQVKLLFSEAL